ncbi:MAG: hypothetical protein GX624_03210 [Actinobacteria bacterium]|nr:hypothetical protein [Actinomycetota bacterium]
MSPRKSLIAVIIVVLAVTIAAMTVPRQAEAASLKNRLASARKALRQSTKRLKAAEAALAAAVVLAGPAVTEPAPGDPSAISTSSDVSAPSATPTPMAVSSTAATPVTPSVEEFKKRVAKARRAVRACKKRVRRLARQYRFQRKMAAWERRGDWMPIIKVAAAKYGVKADGMYRMMMRESGGRRFAGSGSPYKGLFQYWTGTWSASWNPYRRDSIYDGSSQIFATAYAISRGMGPQMWTTTFASQY